MSDQPSDFSLKIVCNCGCGGEAWDRYLQDGLGGTESYSFAIEFRGSDCGQQRVKIDRLIRRVQNLFGIRDRKGLVGVCTPKHAREQ